MSVWAVDPTAVKDAYDSRALPLVAWSLVTLAALFAFLWLDEIVRDLLAGGSSRSASDWHVPTNPVHVLDLAFFLPAVCISGILLFRRNGLGYASAPGALVFLALTCLPILATPVVATIRGHESEWTVVPPISVLLLTTVGLLWRTLRALGSVPSRAAAQT